MDSSAWPLEHFRAKNVNLRRSLLLRIHACNQEEMASFHYANAASVYCLDSKRFLRLTMVQMANFILYGDSKQRMDWQFEGMND
ncbi:hypothetical protein F9L69_15680 [Brucella melitensis]|uniref:Uncharacterized protein n=3 Tax=Brucella TaxID=234 RepID=A0A7L9MGK5_BRUSS|nr:MULTISPECIES: hypothetical protein [Brucella]AAL53557.1 hypothetical protein BMEII0315 [Brucella melitensis bv. 1 str. 16M]AZS92539.1 hypothetical protein EIA50_12290 [Brucella abortus]EEZ09523.1 predicted protein [Brucella melitensis bv. 3 str. Ether]EEZ16150.1 predicted protein [Brucella melitensis bv. 2 str. 63/9]EEZ28616.1 predicted protein [Brucella pinnipedialis M292/94/1]